MNAEATSAESIVQVLGAINTLLLAENMAVYDDPNLPEPRAEVAKSFFFVRGGAGATAVGVAAAGENKNGDAASAAGSKPAADPIAPAPVQRDPEEMIQLMEKGFTFMRIVVKGEVDASLGSIPLPLCPAPCTPW